MWPALWFSALLAVTSVHVLLAPYTKVEESFTLHAVHDFLRYGPWPLSFDKVSYSKVRSDISGITARSQVQCRAHSCPRSCLERYRILSHGLRPLSSSFGRQ